MAERHTHDAAERKRNAKIDALRDELEALAIDADNISSLMLSRWISDIGREIKELRGAE